MADTPQPAHIDDWATLELRGFLRADRFNRDAFQDDTAMVEWMLSRARWALKQPPRAQPAEPSAPAVEAGAIELARGMYMMPGDEEPRDTHKRRALDIFKAIRDHKETL